jgi:hypothetical protein
LKNLRQLHLMNLIKKTMTIRSKKTRQLLMRSKRSSMNKRMILGILK